MKLKVLTKQRHHRERSARAPWLAISYVRFLYGLPTYTYRKFRFIEKITNVVRRMCFLFSRYWILMSPQMQDVLTTHVCTAGYNRRVFFHFVLCMTLLQIHCHFTDIRHSRELGVDVNFVLGRWRMETSCVAKVSGIYSASIFRISPNSSRQHYPETN